MTEQLPTDMDFDALYRGEQPSEDLQLDCVPWDIGAPQPAIVALEEGGTLRGSILDIGCGLGDNALFLAERGHRVTGVDGSPTALGKAREKAGARGLDARFVQADATTLEGVEPGFDTVLDSALFHCLVPEQRSAYAEAIHRVTNPGAVLHLICFGGEDPGATLEPVSKEELHAALDARWDITSIEPASYSSGFTRDTISKVREITETIGIEPEKLSYDEQGHAMLAMWQLRAVRR
ncbi:class I SAM-dependent methyltransferase [Sciscionella marina]|uniref:class I SAM-dependent methyltransferase n=1 Tax=Sciscionella marina TaxID=508770 RepID=UPI000360B6DE|nr:class I SAM-dependent methyltransferase [Sciscionella marina]